MLTARAQKDNHNLAFLKDSDDKSIGTSIPRQMIAKKKKPIQVVQPSIKNQPKSNISSEMEIADMSMNKSAME